MATELATCKPGWATMLREHAFPHASAPLVLALGLTAGFALMMRLDTTLG